jgi:hypothetical protein
MLKGPLLKALYRETTLEWDSFIFFPVAIARELWCTEWFQSFQTLWVYVHIAITTRAAHVAGIRVLLGDFNFINARLHLALIRARRN